MGPRLTTKQLAIAVLVPLAILGLSWAAYAAIGEAALLLPPVLVGIFLAYLIVEVRRYTAGLFVRQVEESRAAFAQYEAVMGLNLTLQPSMPLPGTRGWAASPDLLREIVQSVLTTPTALVVEASSGTSTLVIAYCLKRLGAGRVIAFEHDPKYAARTRAAINAHGLDAHASVVLAPLVDQDVNGRRMKWYDLSKAELKGPIDLLVVDGPPDTTQPLARYPAVPLLHGLFAKQARVLLDDGARPDERVIADRWCAEYQAVAEYLPLEKGAWSLRFGA